MTSDNEAVDRDEPSEYYQRARNTVNHAVEDGEISQRDADYILELLEAYNEDEPQTKKPESEKFRSKRTLGVWGNRLRAVATRLDGELVEASADELNQLWSDMLTGRHEKVKDDGLAKNTVSSYQSTTRKFVESHDDLDIPKTEISVTAGEKNTVDERDIFTSDEIHEIRDATEHPRDKALVDLFAFTGQRLRAVQTLRVKDINLDDGTFHLNTEAGGLKGADGKRPLLMAEASVRDWLDVHPHSDNPEAYLFCHRPSYRADNDGMRPLSQKSIRGVLDEAAEKADIDKPTHPHNFRHSFVTIAKREYGLDNMTIKGLIGHRQESRVMEETYAHLVDEDHIKAAQKQTGVREVKDDEKKPFTPDVCPSCGEPQPDDAVACSSCGTRWGPNARPVQEMAQEAVHETALDAETEEQREEADEIRKLVEENPEAVAEALDPETLAQALSDE